MERQPRPWLAEEEEEEEEEKKQRATRWKKRASRGGSEKRANGERMKEGGEIPWRLGFGQVWRKKQVSPTTFELTGG